jgi:hypothetical protein
MRNDTVLGLCYQIVIKRGTRSPQTLMLKGFQGLTELFPIYIIAGGSLNTTDGHGALLAIGILIQALSGQAVLFPENCENAAKMTLWLC